MQGVQDFSLTICSILARRHPLYVTPFPYPRQDRWVALPVVPRSHPLLVSLHDMLWLEIVQDRDEAQSLSREHSVDYFVYPGSHNSCFCA